MMANKSFHLTETPIVFASLEGMSFSIIANFALTREFSRQRPEAALRLLRAIYLDSIDPSVFKRLSPEAVTVIKKP